MLSFHARASLLTACFTCVFILFSFVYMTKNGYYPYQNVFQPVRSPSCCILNSSHVSYGHSVIVSCSRVALYCLFYLCFHPSSVVYMTKNGYYPYQNFVSNNNFSEVVIANTIAEIIFTWSESIGKAHSSIHAIMRDVNFNASFRGAMARVFSASPGLTPGLTPCLQLLLTCIGCS